MKRRSGIDPPTAQSIASFVQANADKAKQAQAPMHHGDMASTREADYKGHHIVVRTTYEIEVDGKPVTGHLGVTNDGEVHYHPIPNQSFPSAIELVERVIDTFPDDFDGSAAPPAPPPHGGHHAARSPKSRQKAGRKKAVRKKAIRKKAR